MEDIIGILFLARNHTHKEHLQTKSFAAHMALGDFYEGIIPLADKLAEAYQGLNGIMKDIPTLTDATGPSKIVLKDLMQQIEKKRYSIKSSALQNIIDEIIALFLSTLYKLNNLS